MTFIMPALGAPAADAKSAKPSFTAALEAFKKDGSESNREALIKAAAATKPAPTVPAEARRPFVMAATYQKEAKAPADFGLAVDSYRDALALAPWWGDAYYNLSVALESAGRLSEAKRALELYLLSKPRDVDAVQDRLFALEAKANLASKENAAKAKTLIVPGSGIGPLRVGMTADEAVAAFGAPTKRYGYDNKNGYHGESIIWGADPATIYMDFYQYTPAKFVTLQQAGYATEDGVKIGMPFAEAQQLLGNPDRSVDYGAKYSAKQLNLCYRRGISIASTSAENRVDRITVYAPDDFERRCPYPR